MVVSDHQGHCPGDAFSPSSGTRKNSICNSASSEVAGARLDSKLDVGDIWKSKLEPVAEFLMKRCQQVVFTASAFHFTDWVEVTR